MGNPVEHDLRHRALAAVGLARGFVIDRGCQALLGAGAVDAAVVDAHRARGRADQRAELRRRRLGIGMDAFAQARCPGRLFLFGGEVIEGRTGKAFAALLERHRLHGHHGLSGITDIERGADLEGGPGIGCGQRGHGNRRQHISARRQPGRNRARRFRPQRRAQPGVNSPGCAALPGGQNASLARSHNPCA